MNLYRFKTFRTSYYFPDICTGNEVLYSLYTPFNSTLAKMYWWAFKKVPLIRHLTKIKDPDNEFPYTKIVQLCPTGSGLSFNMGSPGPEQKISFLGITLSGEYFFGKYSVKQKAQELSRNEINILKHLQNTNLAPALLDYRIEDDYCFFRTTCIKGKNPSNISLNENIVDIAIKINHHHLIEKDSKLLTGLSHGDFTPWNIIIENDRYRLIDWEMADERELGYDLLNYIVHVAAVLNTTDNLAEVIAKYKTQLVRYFKSFDVLDYTPYIKAFANRKIAYYENHENREMANKYRCLI